MDARNVHLENTAINQDQVPANQYLRAPTLYPANQLGGRVILQQVVLFHGIPGKWRGIHVLKVGLARQRQ